MEKEKRAGWVQQVKGIRVIGNAFLEREGSLI